MVREQRLGERKYRDDLTQAKQPHNVERWRLHVTMYMDSHWHVYYHLEAGCDKFDYYDIIDIRSHTAC